ncbi:piggyBac transposable element-derived protein 3 [Trichonephila clavipes]|nr:piggyBac transposable element-derived protein 3 [Trichonephila clavipes]
MNRWFLVTITIQPKCLSKSSRLGLDIKHGCCVPAVAIRIYCRKKPEIENSPLESRVVWELLSSVESPDKYEIFFDNFFSSHKLLKELPEDNSKATGKIQDNRSEGCSLKSPKEANK